MATQTVEPTSIPWDTSVGNRFALYSPEDHSAPLWIATILSFVYILGVLSVRVFIKLRVFGWDDCLIIVSTVLSSVQSIVVFSALNVGLGKVSEKMTNIGFAGELVFSSRIIFILSLYLAKLSLLFLLRRLFVQDQKATALLCDSVIGFTVTCGLVSSLLSGVRCPTANFFVQHCQNQVTRWSVITAMDVLTEVLALILPVYMVWQLQMQIETKLRVIAAFCFRVVVIALSAVHLQFWIGYSRRTPSSIAIVPSLIWQQILLATSLIAATIPNLKAFLQSLSASWRGADWGYTTKAYGNETIEMNNMSGISPSSQKAIKRTYTRKNDPEFEAHITTSGLVGGRRSSLGSGESQDLIIRKETVFTVERS